MVYDDLLARFTEMSKDILGDNLVGVYLHGSAVMDCFNPQKSDLDLILVVERALDDGVKLAFLAELVRLNEEAPEKGFELSIVRRAVCDPFVYPTPYELHFSNAYLDRVKREPARYVAEVVGCDRDLAAHFTIIGRYGRTLFGAPIGEVFGAVPRADYIDSILFDIEHAREDISENPMYMTLNLCRVLAYLREGLVCSKKAGGEWGLRALPERFRATVADALLCYAGDKVMRVREEEAVAFAEYMRSEIDACMG